MSAAAADRVRLHAPAKLNLWLDVLARRPDGFHEVDTGLVALEWGDGPAPELVVDFAPEALETGTQIGRYEIVRQIARDVGCAPRPAGVHDATSVR